MVLLGGQHPGLRAELHLQAEQLPKLTFCMGIVVAPLVKDKEGADPFKALDAIEDMVLVQFSKVLNHHQQARFEELGCQFAGPMALRLKHYASRLELSAAQRKKIAELVDAYTEKAADPQRAGFVVRSQEVEKQLKALARELDEKILALLSDKQRAMWTKSLGKKFDWTGMEDG
jgi:hypothetical protein